MNKKYNIEELKYLIADQLTGEISKEDNEALESALLDSAELREFRDDMKKTLDFVQDVKFDEPAPQYWNSLLPRIHQRIEERETNSFSWDKVASMWKILVPIAAVLLIAIIYYIARPVDPGITKEEPKIEELKKDSSREQIEKKDKEVTPETKPDNKVKDERKAPVDGSKTKVPKFNKENIVKDEQSPDNIEEPLNDPSKDGFTVIDVEETSIFGNGEAAGLDEETENELKKLNENEKKSLLQELEDINL